MSHRDAVLVREMLANDRAVARGRISLHAHQSGHPFADQAIDQRSEVHLAQDLILVAPPHGRRQLDPRPLAHAALRVLFVLEPANLGGRRQVLPMPVLDARLSEHSLEAIRVRPRVLASTQAPTLAHVYQRTNAAPLSASRNPSRVNP